jgi:hypothetical protein
LLRWPSEHEPDNHNTSLRVRADGRKRSSLACDSFLATLTERIWSLYLADVSAQALGGEGRIERCLSKTLGAMKNRAVIGFLVVALLSAVVFPRAGR